MGQLFISGDKVNVTGLVLAGSADFKTELSLSAMFDQRLQSKVFKLVDTSYGGKNGFNQAIEISTEVLSNMKLIQDKKLIERYSDDISQRDVLHCQSTEEDKIFYQLQRKRRINLILQTKRHDKNMRMMPLLEWFADNYKKNLELCWKLSQIRHKKDPSL